MVAQSRQSRLQLPDRHDWIIGPPKDLCPCRALVHEAPIAVQRGHMQRLLWPKPCLTRCIQSSTSLFGVCKTLPSSCTMASELHLVSHLDLLTQCSLQWCLNEDRLMAGQDDRQGLGGSEAAASTASSSLERQGSAASSAASTPRADRSAKSSPDADVLGSPLKLRWVWVVPSFLHSLWAAFMVTHALHWLLTVRCSILDCKGFSCQF